MFIGGLEGLFYQVSEISVALPASCFPHQPPLTNGLILLSIYSADIFPEYLSCEMSEVIAPAKGNVLFGGGFLFYSLCCYMRG